MKKLAMYGKGGIGKSTTRQARSSSATMHSGG